MFKYLHKAADYIKSMYSNNDGSMDETVLGRKNLLFSNIASNIATNLYAGNFFTGFLLLLSADDNFMGLITLAGTFGNALQVLSPLIMERFPKRKLLLTGVRGFIYFVNILVIGIIPLVPGTNSIKLMIILSAILLVNLVNALSSPGFAVWLIKSIPESVRAKYFSLLNMVCGVVNFTVIMCSSRIIDSFKKNGNELQGLLLFRGIALLFCLADIYFLLAIKEYPYQRSDTKISLISIFIDPFKEKKYLVSVLAACLWSFSSSIPGPYYGVYLLKDLKVSYFFINIINMVNIPVLIFLTPLWRKRIEATSWFRTLSLAIFLFSLSYPGLALTTRETLFMYPLSSLINIMVMPGISLVSTNAQYINIPQKNQTNFIGFFNTMNNLSALLGVFIGKEFLTLTGSVFINLFGISMQNKQYILIVSALAMQVSALLIHFMQKWLDRQRSTIADKSVSIG